MRGLVYRAAMAAIAAAALVLVFWQAGWLGSLPFATQKLALLCACAAYTLLIVPLIIRKLSAPASIGIWSVTVCFNIACIIITCLKSGVFYIPIIVATAVYALLQLAIFSIFTSANHNTQ